MGKDWDKAVPSVAIWRECLRVLKPGAFAFVMSGPRMDCLSEMGKRLAEAGFETGFTPIFWAYASGFPKAANMGKLVDKRWKKRTEYDELAHYLSDARRSLGLSQKDIAQHFPSKTGGLTGCVWNWENAKNVPTEEQWLVLKRVLGLDTRFDWLIEQETRRYEEAEREVIGNAQRQGKPPQPMWGEEDGQDWDITAPATPEAQALDGSYAGFSPKPAVEVVIVAMKPLAHGTYIDQALDNRKGVTWLDEGRIPYQSDDKPPDMTRGGFVNAYEASKTDWGAGDPYTASQSGRFPANLLVSDNAVDDGRDIEAGSVRTRHKHRPESAFCGGHNILGSQEGYGDSGGFSRYFSLDKWWQATAERLDTEPCKLCGYVEEHGNYIDELGRAYCDECLICGDYLDEPQLSVSELPESVQRTFPFLVVPKAGKKEKNLGCEGLPEKQMEEISGGGGIHTEKADAYQARKSPRRNFHPTVKPLKLMSYLITLGSRPGDLVLDPFAGTCTTGMAAKMLGRNYLMIEIDEEWCRIGRRRVEAVQERML